MSRKPLAILAAVLLVVAAFVAGIHRRVQESETLRRDSFTMRAVIDQYTDDLHRFPRSLHDLEAAGYVRHGSVDDKRLQRVFRDAIASEK
jgi:hypothetical protein